MEGGTSFRINIRHHPDDSSSAKYLSLTLCCAALFLLLLLRRKGNRKRGTGLDNNVVLPGPRQFFLGNYLNLLEIADKTKTVKTVANWCRNNNGRPAMKLDFGPFSTVVLLCPNYIHKLFGSSESDHLGKPYLGYGVLKPVEWADGIMHSKGEKWKSRRKLINPIFSYNSLLGYVPAWNEGGRRLVSNLESHFIDRCGGDGDHHRPRPIQSILSDTAFDSLCRTVFGIGVEEEEEDESGGDLADYTKQFLEGTKRFLEIVATRVLQPWLGYEPLFRLHPMSSELSAFYHLSRQFITKLSWKLGEEEEKQGGGGEDQSFSSKQNKNSSLLKDLVCAGLGNEGIYEEAITLLLTGFETTGSLLHSLLFFLALHPSIQERCREEVDAVFDNDAEEFSADGDISPGGLRQLVYLEQCLMETLRMVPPAPAYCRELEGPLQLDEELELPAGTTVGVWVLGIHMNPQLYPQPERYDPDRFSPEMRAARHPYSYMPFSAGPRKCIGYKFGRMEMLIDAAHVLRHFTFATTTERFEDVVWLYNTTLRPQTPMEFVFQRRRNKFK